VVCNAVGQLCTSVEGFDGLCQERGVKCGSLLWGIFKVCVELVLVQGMMFVKHNAIADPETLAKQCPAVTV
jgi:hypothetical protein